MIEVVFLPGKGSSESRKEGRRGRITDHCQVITGQITDTQTQTWPI